MISKMHPGRLELCADFASWMFIAIDVQHICVAFPQRHALAVGPMLEQDGKHFSRRWGYLSRAGLNDKSQFTRQIEKYADVYTSRVANFLRYTPYMYFRSPSQSLAHDRNLSEYYRQRYGNINGSLDPASAHFASSAV